jgi:hypothetical protein
MKISEGRVNWAPLNIMNIIALKLRRLIEASGPVIKASSS